MSMNTIPVDKNLREMTRHGDPSFPMNIYWDDFANFKDGAINWHWHKEIQFSVVLDSDIQFFFEGVITNLHAGEAIFINKNVLHQIKPVQNRAGKMFSLVFDESFIAGEGEDRIEKKYVQPLTGNNALKYRCFKNELDWQKQVVQNLLAVYDCFQKKDFGYELLLKATLYQIWYTLVREIQEDLQMLLSESTLDEQRVKLAIQFVRENFTRKITLGDIAASMHLSKSECCRCFQRVIRISPVEFVIQTRINEAARLLRLQTLSVTEIANRVGFDDVSNFGKAFKNQMDCSPTSYKSKSK